MNLIICLDEKNGMMFNRRRQSRDSKVCEKILELAEGKKLWMNSYSAKLFPENAVVTDENFLQKAEKGDFCFAEQKVQSIDNTEKIYMFLWNRRYPADVFFDFNLTEMGFTLCGTEEFQGSSHEKITLYIFNKEGK